MTSDEDLEKLIIKRRFRERSLITKKTCVCWGGRGGGGKRLLILKQKELYYYYYVTMYIAFGVLVSISGRARRGWHDLLSTLKTFELQHHHHHLHQNPQPLQPSSEINQPSKCRKKRYKLPLQPLTIGDLHEHEQFLYPCLRAPFFFFFFLFFLNGFFF